MQHQTMQTTINLAIKLLEKETSISYIGKIKKNKVLDFPGEK